MVLVIGFRHSTILRFIHLGTLILQQNPLLLRFILNIRILLGEIKVSIHLTYRQNMYKPVIGTLLLRQYPQYNSQLRLIIMAEYQRKLG